MEAASAGQDGKWMVTLGTPAAGGPYEIVIRGDDEVVLKGILIGEVWVCSGQSNMQMSLKGSDDSPMKDSKKEVSAAHYPTIRLFTVSRCLSYTPQTDAGGNWASCTPGSAAGFSAAAYFFGRILEEKLRVPIGLISSNWGGTVAEAWTSGEALRAMPEFDSALNSVDSVRQLPEGAVRYDIMAVKPIGPLDHSANTVSVLYNGMIAPLIPYGIKGVIWYQGESNIGRADQYEKLFPLMITDWRVRWKEGVFPFYFVQIAPFAYSGDSTAAAALRDAQRKTMSVPNTGMVVTSDIGDIKNIHPANKREVGRRLAMWALARTYDKKGFEYSGPLYERMRVRGDTVVLSFTHAAGGLTTQGGPLTGFEIAGGDGRFVPARGKIVGERVLVHSDAVKDPRAVRYDWYATATASLFNRAGLPAASFSSDTTGEGRKTAVVGVRDDRDSRAGRDGQGNRDDFAAGVRNAPDDGDDYAVRTHQHDWTHHYAMGSPSWDAFERFPGNPVFKGRKGMEWPVNGFLFKDPQHGAWYLYIGEYRENYAAEKGDETKDMNCVIYKSVDRGQHWSPVGDLFPAHQAAYDSLRIEAPDVMVVYADGKYHMIFDFVGSGDTWASMDNSGIGYAVADRPEGPFVISAKPLRMNTDYKAHPLEGRYSRVYAPMIIKREHDWVMLHMMDALPAWTLAMATASRPEGPYSDSKPVLHVETKTPYPPLQEFFPAWIDGGYVYLPATSVALNRNYQSVFRVKPEDLGDAAKYETFAAGGFWHSLNLPDEHSGIWGQTISGMVDKDTLYAMYPSKDLKNYGTINLAKAPWPGMYRKRGLQLGANAGKSFSYIKKAVAFRRLDMDFRLDGTMSIVWDLHTPIDIRDLWGKFDLSRNTRHKELQVNENGWKILVGDSKAGLTAKDSGSWTGWRAGVNALRVRQNGGMYVCSLNGVDFFKGALAADPGPVGLYLEENSHVAVDRMVLTGDRVDGWVTYGFYEAILAAGNKDSVFSFVNDPHFVYGRGAVSKHTGVFAKWNFEGRAVQLLLPRGPQLGAVRVFLDGKLVKTAALKANVWGQSSVVYEAAGLSGGLHALYLEAVDGLLPLDCIKVKL